MCDPPIHSIFIDAIKKMTGNFTPVIFFASASFERTASVRRLQRVIINLMPALERRAVHRDDHAFHPARLHKGVDQRIDQHVFAGTIHNWREVRCETMSNVIVKENESLDSALRRFKRNCAKAGIQQEIRKREHYEKPSVRRKKKSEAARKRKFK